MISRLFKCRAAAIAAVWLWSAAAGVVFLANATAQTESVQPFPMTAVAFPAASHFPGNWQTSFLGTISQSRSLWTASPTAVSIVAQAITPEQLDGDPVEAAGFSLALIARVDRALRTGVPPVTLSAEVAHSQRRGNEIATGPRGRIDRPRRYESGRSDGLLGGPARGAGTAGMTGGPWPARSGGTGPRGGY
ncbi:MAG TPA: hypothetical protein VMW87_06605 [Spirochaetia bacterium]|nr:hypothetical protein [Spirochaetia bacterium]